MTKDPHHHGNLREALITAALELLQEGGIEGLTLRRAAARAGVSHAAPAHHFDGLQGLLTATAARAFQMFTDSMVRARDAAPRQPLPRLLGVGEGYIAFARTHAGLFHLMFATPGLCRDDPALMAQSNAAYEVLRKACAPFAGPSPEALELAVWSLVHGYAALTGAARTDPGGRKAAAPPFSALLALLVSGREQDFGDLPLAPDRTLG